MKRLNLSGAVLASALALALTSGCSFGGSSDTVISYNSPEQWANWGKVLESFEKETGIDAPSDDKNSGKVMAALEAEKDSPAGDTAYYGPTFGMDAAEAGLVTSYKNDKLDDIPDELKDPDGKWFTVHSGAIAMLVNTEAIGDAEVPKCFKDLTEKQYAGKVSFLDPATAAVGQSVMTAANLAMGGDYDDWKPGLDWAKKIKANGKLDLPTETATNQLAQGEIPILIDADFNGFQTAEAQDAPIEVVYPCEGTISAPYVMSLVKNAPHEDNAKKFLDFVLSDKAQKLFAESYLRPVRSDVEIPADVAKKMLPQDEYERLVKAPDFAALKEATPDLIEQWKAEVAG